MAFGVYYVSDTVLNALSNLSIIFSYYSILQMKKYIQLIESYVHVDVPMRLNLTVQKMSVGKSLFLTLFYSTLLKYNVQKVKTWLSYKYKKNKVNYFLQLINEKIRKC